MSIELLEAEDETTVATPAKRWSLRSLAFVVALLAIGSTAVYAASAGKAKRGANAVSAKVLEERYGARVDLVATAALGGMVELRFTVLDTKKADALFHDPDKMPRLLVEGVGQTLEPPSGMKHSMKMVNGGSYFILYGNRGGHVKEGSKISVVVGDIRLEHLTAKA
jgi:hypothetical protein